MADPDGSDAFTATSTIGLPRSLHATEPPPALPDYRFIKVIGRGAFGTVWLAEEPLAGVYRAIKVLDGGRHDTSKRRAGLANLELQGLHAYQTRARGHPHLIQIYKTGLCTSPAAPLRVERRSDAGHWMNSSGMGRSLSPRMGQSPQPSAGLTPPAFVYYVMEIADHARGAQPHRLEDYEPLTLAAVLRQKLRLPFNTAPDAAVAAGTGLRRGASPGTDHRSSPLAKGGHAGGASRDDTTPLAVLDVALALLDAIEHLHRAGIQHRDVKPSNVLFVDGVLRLADVGLVGEQSDESVGTSAYLPPDGKPDDLYSLGKVVYELVTGLPARQFPEWPGELGPSSDARYRPLRALINKLCHPSAEQRISSLSACRSELSRIAAPPRALANARRRSVVWFGIAVFLSFVFGGYSVQWWRDHHDPTAKRWGRPPYNGAERDTTMVHGSWQYLLTRRHAPGKTDRAPSVNSDVEFSDLQTRLADGRLHVMGTYAIKNLTNPIRGTVLDERGEISQIWLIAENGQAKWLEPLYFGQPGPAPGVRSRFGRRGKMGIPLDTLVAGGGRVIRVYLAYAEGATLDECRRRITQLGIREVAAVQIATIAYKPASDPPFNAFGQSPPSP